MIRVDMHTNNKVFLKQSTLTLIILINNLKQDQCLILFLLFYIITIYTMKDLITKNYIELSK